MQNRSDTSSTTRPTIFLVNDDRDGVRPLTTRLRSLGYRVLVSVHPDDALEWTGSEFIHADLLLLDLVCKTPEEVLRVGRHLRQHAKYDGQTPLVVMADHFGHDLEGTDVEVSPREWVTYVGEADQLPQLLARLMPAAVG